MIELYPMLFKSTSLRLSLLAIILVSLPSWSLSNSRLKGLFNVTHSHIEFQYKDNSQGYVLSAMHTQVEGRLRGGGLLAPLTKPVNSQTEGILGREIKGSLRVRLQTDADSPRLACILEIDDVIEGLPARVSTRFEIPLRITGGKLEDLERGETVTFEATPEGQTRFLEALRSGFEQMLHSALAQTLEGSLVTPEIRAVKLKKSVQVRASSSQIRIDSLALLYDVSLTANL